MQSTFDALDAIGRFATAEEVRARLPFDEESINRMLRYLVDCKLVNRRGEARGFEFCIAVGAVRPGDARGGYRANAGRPKSKCQKETDISR